MNDADEKKNGNINNDKFIQCRTEIERSFQVRKNWNIH